jgi:hypothetical protein
LAGPIALREDSRTRAGAIGLPGAPVSRIAGVTPRRSDRRLVAARVAARLAPWRAGG